MRNIKMSIHNFRDVAKRCPSEVGTFDSASDVLTFTMPEDPSDAFKEALMQYANMSVRRLKAELGKVDQRGGARKRGVKA